MYILYWNQRQWKDIIKKEFIVEDRGKTYITLLVGNSLPENAQLRSMCNW